MPSFRDAFPSKYLGHQDLHGAPLVVTIGSVGFEDIGSGKDGERKIIVTFEETAKPLICNKTNAVSIAELVGSDDIDRWPGQRVQLVTATTDFQGKRVKCVRIERPPVKPRARRAAPTGGDSALDDALPGNPGL